MNYPVEAAEELLNSILADENGMNEIQQAARTPEGLIERVLVECKEYSRAGVRGQYKGTFRGYTFLVGKEGFYDKKNKPSVRFVFCIGDKLGEPAIPGLRYESDKHPYLTPLLKELSGCARDLYERRVIDEIMTAVMNPDLPDSGLCTDPFVI